MKVKAFSKHRIQFFLDQVGPAQLETGRLCIVSIKDSHGDYAISEHPNVLQLEFDDEEPKDTDHLQRYYDLGRVPFNESHALQVEQFFQRVKTTGKCNFIAINCMSGSSRSGAIAAYAASYFNIPDHIFSEYNAHIAPNKWVLQCFGLDYVTVMRKISSCNTGHQGSDTKKGLGHAPLHYSLELR